MVDYTSAIKFALEEELKQLKSGVLLIERDLDNKKKKIIEIEEELNKIKNNEGIKMSDNEIWITKREYNFIIRQVKRSMIGVRSDNSLSFIGNLKKVSEGGVIHIV